MKKFILLAFLGMMSLVSATTGKAQVSINVSIGSQPTWAPVYYESINYIPVKRYVPVTHYVPVRRHYIQPRRQRINHVRYYDGPSYHKVKYKKAHGHHKFKHVRRDKGIERIIRPRG